MNTPEIRNWFLKPECNVNQLTEALAENYSLQVESEDNLDMVTVMDDHDWDIWYANRLLVRKGKNHYQLLTDDQVEEIGGVKNDARFWWDLPESAVREALKPIVDLRAFMPVAEMQLSRTNFILRNADDKIVVRLSLSTFSEIQTEAAAETERPKSSHFVQINALRGYQGAFKAVMKLLQPCLNEELESASLQAIMQLHGYGPARDEGNTDQYGITNDEPVEQAIRQMSLLMLQVARRNEQGVIDDIDTEFLHQYRVSLRKTRSLLNLMKAALPSEIHLRLKVLLAELSGVTNMLRDLDVFLLERDYYQALLPENFSDGLTHLFRMIAADREKARKFVHKSFLSDKHAHAFDEVITLLQAEPCFESEVSSKPVLQVAKKKILNRYRRISIVGSEIHEGTPDEDVHQLRIECKKLRYMMEFFAELFPKKRIKQLIKSLKKLQTILGDFNDYSVQKEFLADYEKHHKKSADVSAAINGLIAVLHQKQLAERTKVQQAFAAFNDDDTADEFQALFGKQKVGE